MNTRARTRRATLKDVAAALGVSPSTVSNAYNRPHHLSPALRDRVFETARELGYPGPHPAARSLRRGENGALGLLFAERLSFAFDDPVATLLVRGVAAAAEEAGLGLLLVPGRPLDTPALSSVQGAAVDGLVLYSIARDDPRVAAALGRRVPLVVVDQPRLPGVPFVGLDDEAAAGSAARHLLALGHRRFGVVSFPLSPDARSGLIPWPADGDERFVLTRARLRGYGRALADAGRPPERDALVYECAVNTREHGREAVRALLAARPDVTAILAMSDQLALGALDAAREHGRPVPSTLSVVGFDDSDAARAADLTSVRQPVADKGLVAARLLIRTLRGEAVPDVTMLPTCLVPRGSSASPGGRSD